MSRTKIWNGYLGWLAKKYPDIKLSELSGKQMKNIEMEFLIEQGTEDVEVNEYGEIVSQRSNKKGVKLKPHTFYWNLYRGCNMQEEAERLKKPMKYCEFRKCHWGEERYDMGACGIAASGETCYSLFPESEDDPAPRFAAYYIHLKEVELNNG